MTVYGHDSAVAALLEAARSDRLHHAWLLAGPKGVGKARFADAAALRLLADAAGPPVDAPGLDVPPEHRIARLIEAGSHPDYMRLSRLFREKTNDHARNISVDQVRGLQRVLVSKPSMSDRRIVVIDAIDDLEPAAANALLKNLEEPPALTLFLLVSHAPGRLLPTIRSRCRMVRFAPLDDAAMTAALRAAMPDASSAEIAELVALGDGSPGRALALAGLDIAGLDAAMDRLFAGGDPTNAERSALARSLSTKAAQPRYEAFLARAPSRIARHARGLAGMALADAIDAWGRARLIAESAVGLSADPQATVFELAGLMARLAPEATVAKA